MAAMATLGSSWAAVSAASPPDSVSVVPRALAVLAGERDRWALWLPVFLGFGVVAYFALPSEPVGWLGGATFGASVMVACAAVATRRHAIMFLGLAAATISGGFLLAQLRTWSVAEPVLERRIGPVQIEGRVRAVEQGEHGRRVLLDRISIGRVAPAATPARVRIRVADASHELWPGDRIAVRAVLTPPPEPSAPGAYDFARQAYFERLGGVGYAVGRVRVLASTASADGGFDFDLAVARLRQATTERIVTALDPEVGGMAAAFLTGDRAAIPPDVTAAMRDAGLAHLIAISGMNFAMAAGLIFFTLRFASAAIEPLALRYPVKKWAAAATIVGIAGYYLLSGETVPTLRAFLMLFVVLLAVILDRTPISMRLAACAAAAIIALAPESLLGASFQMSFAAVVALIAFYEVVARRLAGWRAGGGWPRLAGIYLAGVILTTLVASFATAPFSVYHFNRMPLYGSLFANLIAIPLTAVVIMPAGLAALVLMPFGWEAAALAPMGWGIEAMILVAREVASWPGTVALVPAMPPAGLAATVLGGLWICLWRRRWRLLGLAPVAAGVATLAFVRVPDILVDDTGRSFAVRDPSGSYVLGPGDKSSFRTETWLRRVGHDRFADRDGNGTAQDDWLSCDALGCLYRRNGQTAAFLLDPRAAAEDCRVAALVVSPEPLPRSRCREPKAVIDRFALWRGGGHTIWLTSSGPRIETVAQYQGDRPWAQRRGRGERRRSGPQ
jgi:competence protein ComEC